MDRKGDCGIRSYAYITGRTFTDVEADFRRRYNTHHVHGSEMRALMFELGWEWTRTNEVPATGCHLVSTRRGFYVVDEGKEIDPVRAPICGYYTGQTLEGRLF